MANFILSPNMNLPVPVVGQEPGPQYATDVNNSLTIIDQHNHTSGSGVLITPAALNINSALTMQNNSLTSILSLTFTPQSADPGPFNFYMKGVDFYGEDGSGNVIRFTQSGSLAGAAGTITGLPSGTASASFAAGTFVFQAATATGANIDGASFIFRNNTASSNGLTLQPPNAMGSNYSVTLPAPNALGQTGVLTYDTANNIGSGTYDSVGVGMTTVGATSISNKITRSVNSVTAPLGGVAVSASTGGATVYTNTSFTGTVGGGLALTTSGNPVELKIISDGTSSESVLTALGPNVQAFVRVQNLTTGVVLGDYLLFNNTTSGASSLTVPASFSFMDFPAAGTYSYAIEVKVGGAGQAMRLDFCVLVGYEIH